MVKHKKSRETDPKIEQRWLFDWQLNHRVVFPYQKASGWFSMNWIFVQNLTSVTFDMATCLEYSKRRLKATATKQLLDWDLWSNPKFGSPINSWNINKSCSFSLLSKHDDSKQKRLRCHKILTSSIQALKHLLMIHSSSRKNPTQILPNHHLSSLATLPTVWTSFTAFELPILPPLIFFNIELNCDHVFPVLKGDWHLHETQPCFPTLWIWEDVILRHLMNLLIGLGVSTKKNLPVSQCLMSVNLERPEPN